MNKIEDFYVLLGQTLDFCQRIEHDLKWIYALLNVNDYSETLENVKKNTLGEILGLLKNIDLKGNPYFDSSDFTFLNSITYKRNYYCHECFNTFNYERDVATWNKTFNNEYQKLLKFNFELNDMSTQILKARKYLYGIIKKNDLVF